MVNKRSIGGRLGKNKSLPAALKGADENFCRSCGEIIKKEAEVCVHCGVRQLPHKTEPVQETENSPNKPKNKPNKSRISAAIFAILLGGFGAHKFYLGRFWLGVLYFIFFWAIIPWIVGIIEGVIYLTMTDKEFETRYVG